MPVFSLQLIWVSCSQEHVFRIRGIGHLNGGKDIGVSCQYNMIVIGPCYGGTYKESYHCSVNLFLLILTIHQLLNDVVTYWRPEDCRFIVSRIVNGITDHTFPGIDVLTSYFDVLLSNIVKAIRPVIENVW